MKQCLCTRNSPHLFSCCFSPIWLPNWTNVTESRFAVGKIYPSWVCRVNGWRANQEYCKAAAELFHLKERCKYSNFATECWQKERRPYTRTERCLTGQTQICRILIAFSMALYRVLHVVKEDWVFYLCLLSYHSGSCLPVHIIVLLFISCRLV